MSWPGPPLNVLETPQEIRGDEREAIARRAAILFQAARHDEVVNCDRLLGALMVPQWLVAICIALWISPHAWAGASSSIHFHVWAAVLLGGAIVSLPIALAVLLPGAILTRHVIAVGQMLMGALLIHLTGGKIETHFHVFGSLAFLAAYRDCRVLVTASLVVAIDHLLRGIYWPQSIYGVLAASPLRSFEHIGWVMFEDAFLIPNCLRGIREFQEVARQPRRRWRSPRSASSVRFRIERLSCNRPTST